MRISFLLPKTPSDPDFGFERSIFLWQNQAVQLHMEHRRMKASLAHLLAEALGIDQSGVGIKAASQSSLLQEDLLQSGSAGKRCNRLCSCFVRPAFYTIVMVTQCGLWVRRKQAWCE